MFRNRLTKVYRHLHKQANRQQITCFRLYDRDLPEFPLIIEIYETNVYVSEYKSKHHLSEEEYENWLQGCIQVIAEVLSVPRENIYTKLRKRKESRQDQYQRVATEGDFFVVKEAGLFFRVNLSDYLDTGLFLDHRITRAMVRDQAKEKKVLNLFCYTGSFSVYAAAGGAAEVVSVDLSNTYLQWAGENFRLNKFSDPHKFKFVKADVLQYLDTLPPSYFDLVIVDPPTFSNSKMMRDFLDIQRDHAGMLNKILRSCSAGAIIYFSTNSRKFELEKDKINSTSIRDITRATTPFDFEGKLQRWCFEIKRG